MTGTWKSTEVLAWTEGDGPGRPPAAPPRRLQLGLAGALTVVLAGILSTDTLCPEHRAWVISLAGVALVAAVTAIVGLVRGWAAAPLLTVVTAAAGVAIGLLDAVHSATRGRLLAFAFGVVCLLACWLAARSLALVRWDRSLRATLRGAPASTTDSTTPTWRETDAEALVTPGAPTPPP